MRNSNHWKTNEDGEPELHYIRLPRDIANDYVVLMDPIVGTGSAAMMAIRVLLDHDVKEDKIILVSLLMAECGSQGNLKHFGSRSSSILTLVTFLPRSFLTSFVHFDLGHFWPRPDQPQSSTLPSVNFDSVHFTSFVHFISVDFYPVHSYLIRSFDLGPFNPVHLTPSISYLIRPLTSVYYDNVHF